MPPTSRPFLASPSAPSDVFTIHTIASRSHLTTSHHHRRDGRAPRPLLGDAIATPRQQPEWQCLDSLPSSPHRPLPRLSSPLSCGEGRAEQKIKPKGRKRENQGEGCRRPLRPFIASPSAPSDVFTIHTIASRSHLTTSHHHRRDGRAPRPLLGDAIATPRQQPEGQRLDSLPSSPPRPRPRLSSPFPGGKSEGREPARAGDPLPLILPTLSTLPGCAWAYGC